MRATVICLLLLLSATAASADDGSMTAPAEPFPKTKMNIHLEMVFNGHVHDLNREQGAVDVVWGSSSADQPPGVYNSSYIPFDLDNFQLSLDWYMTYHPDWLAYKCDRTLAYYPRSTLPPLDFSNPGVRSFQWDNWVDAPLDRGYRSIAVDLLHLTNDQGRCGHYDLNKQWIQQYSGQTVDSVFAADVLAWESATRDHIHAYPQSGTMQVNVSYTPDAWSLKLLSLADLVFDECGFTNCGNSERNVTTPSEWSDIVKHIDYAHRKGLCYMTNGEEPGLTQDITPAERQWVIGNYLLVRDNCTYMYMTGFTKKQEQDYGRLIRFREYRIKIGSPAGDMYQQQGAWQRGYSNGFVLVNPDDQTAVVDLPPGDWVDVDGNPVRSPATLEKQTALILLKANQTRH